MTPEGKSLSSQGHAWAEALRRQAGRPRGMYADPFDPITAGHLSVIAHAAPLFGELVLLVTGADSPEALFEAEERALLVGEVTCGHKNLSVEHTSGSLADVARERGVHFLLFAVTGPEDARRVAATARSLFLSAPELKPIFVPVPERLARVGSAELKALARQGACLSRYCHPIVARRLQARLTAAAI